MYKISSPMKSFRLNQDIQHTWQQNTKLTDTVQKSYLHNRATPFTINMYPDGYTHSGIP